MDTWKEAKVASATFTLVKIMPQYKEKHFNQKNWTGLGHISKFRLLQNTYTMHSESAEIYELGAK